MLLALRISARSRPRVADVPHSTRSRLSKQVEHMVGHLARGRRTKPHPANHGPKAEARIAWHRLGRRIW